MSDDRDDIASEDPIDNVIKKSMSTIPCVRIVQQLLQDKDKFLKQTRFNKDNMIQLWTVCQSRPEAVNLKEFLRSKDVLEIFQKSPLSKAKQNTKKRTFTDSDPTSLERAVPRSEEVAKNEADVFERIAKFRGSSSCSEFLTVISGTPLSFFLVMGWDRWAVIMILQWNTPTKSLVQFRISYMRDYDIFRRDRWSQAIHT
jgi:hypothetical protein